MRAGIAQAERLETGAGPSAESLVADAAAAARASTAAQQPVQRWRVRPAAPATPHPVGTISWSGHGSDTQGRRAGTHVVWSNGVVTHRAAACTGAVAAGAELRAAAPQYAG